MAVTDPRPCLAAIPAADPDAPRPACPPMRGSHHDACTDPERCRGCLPRTALPHLEVCGRCRMAVQDGLRALPRLSDDLLAPTRHQAAGATPRALTGALEGQPEALPDYAPDPVRDCRDAIRATLVTWCRVLHDDAGAPLPADTVTAMAALIHAWSDRLLAHPDHADQLVHDVATLVRTGQRYAYPAPPPGQLLGRCPDCLHDVRSGDAGTARCPGCGTTRTVDEWHAVLAGDIGAQTVATVAALSGWLSWRHGRHIAATTLRQWASRGLAAGLRLERPADPADPDGPGLRDATGRALYTIASATRCAERVYGQPRGTHV